MTKVFIGGSRKISRLSQAVTNRIDNILVNNFTVLVGDADGVDVLVQKYLFAKNYSQVIVFCTGNFCRNNIGHWETRNVPTVVRSKGFQFYTIKDLAMAKEATHGFMIWDGKSKGTLNNILNLLQMDKKTLVFFAPTQAFYSVRIVDELLSLLDQCDHHDVEIFEKELALSNIIGKLQQGAIGNTNSQMRLNLESLAESENNTNLSEVTAILA